MMIPTPTDSTNLLFKVLPDWDENTLGECITIPVSHYDGIYYSYWQPTFLERLKILFGGHVRVCICADFHPSIAVDTQ